MYKPGTSGEWWSDKRLNRYANDCPLRLVNGVRGVGKTTWGMSRVAENWDKGKQTVWSRLFKDHMKDPTFIGHFLAGGKRQGYIPDDWIATPEGVFTDETKSEQPVIFMDINTAYSRQGNEYNDVQELICDEYTVRPGELYPRNYVSKLHSLIGTIGRSKDLKVTMFSNWTALSNPIWGVMKIYPGSKDVTVFKDKGVAIEICRNGYYNQDMPGDDTPLGRVLANLGGVVMESAKEDPSYTLVNPLRPKTRASRMVLATDGGNFRLWEGDMNFYEPCSIQPGDWVFTNDIKQVGARVRLIPQQTLQRLRKEIEEGRTRFLNQNTLYSVMGFVYARYK
jgi:hypothetical protein